jgi:hypothetical protein
MLEVAVRAGWGAEAPKSPSLVLMQKGHQKRQNPMDIIKTSSYTNKAVFGGTRLIHKRIESLINYIAAESS